MYRDASKPNRVGRRGQALTELALITPVILLLLSAILDVGRIFYFDVALRDAVRQGARVATSTSVSDATIQAAVQNAAPLLNVPSGNITVSPSPRTSANSGQAVTVTATYAVSIMTPFVSNLFGSQYTLVRQAQMVLF